MSRWGREPTLPPIRPSQPSRRTRTEPGPEEIEPRPVRRTPTDPGPDAARVRRTPTLPADDLD